MRVCVWGWVGGGHMSLFRIMCLCIYAPRYVDVLVCAMEIAVKLCS